MKIKLTDDGRNMLLNFVQGNKIKFTKAVFGNGDYRKNSETPQIVNGIISISFASNPTVDTESDGVAKLTVNFDNSDVSSGFHITEIGYFAKLITAAEDGTETEGEEKLYAIGNATESESDYIPPVDERAVDITYDGYVYIGDADVSAVLSESAIYATKDDFEKHIKDKNNPHEVTKGQVGLSNVPNVTTNDQTPTYADTQVLETLSSGETLSVAFSKIKKAISALINHIGSKNNPHAVTAKQVGAAETKHTHSAGDINDGVLSVERGGTGYSVGAIFKKRETAGGDQKTIFGIRDSNSGVCNGNALLPGGLLIQWGRVNVDTASFFVNFAKEYANTDYALVFPTCSSDVNPDWKNPDKSLNGFKMNRTVGIVGKASQTADWIAIGQAKE